VHNMGEYELSLELFSLGHQHPLSFKGWQDHSPLVQRTLAEIKGRINKEHYAHAWQVGAKRDLELTAKVLLQMNNPTFIQELRENEAALLAGKLGPDQILIDPLSDREIEVLKCLAKGYTNKQISEELFITVGTVKTHLYNIYQKMGVKNRSQAILTLRENNQIEDQQ